MQNNFSQGKSVGICTCIALNWAKQTLKRGRGLKTYTELGLDEHTMNAQMAVLRKYDNSPAEQCDLVGLSMAESGDRTVTSIDDVLNITKRVQPHIAIFWTQTHTMGYRYGHNEKEFFDNEIGLFRSKKTFDIKAKMSLVIQGYGQPVEGMRIVKLA